MITNMLNISPSIQPSNFQLFRSFITLSHCWRGWLPLSATKWEEVWGRLHSSLLNCLPSTPKNAIVIASINFTQTHSLFGWTHFRANNFHWKNHAIFCNIFLHSNYPFRSHKNNFYNFSIILKQTLPFTPTKGGRASKLMWEAWL